jgi:hypothetical protein
VRVREIRLPNVSAAFADPYPRRMKKDGSDMPIAFGGSGEVFAMEIDQTHA